LYQKVEQRNGKVRGREVAVETLDIRLAIIGILLLISIIPTAIIIFVISSLIYLIKEAIKFIL
jgi:hypothetical protein